jgi:trk system potassium uptake protein TrkH
VFLHDEEFRVYLALAAVAAVVLTIEVWSYGFVHGEAAIRAGVFQAVSLVTTTGYATVNFGVWPTLAVLSLFALMFVGASAGSTGGSIKVVRHLLLAKILRRELDQTVSPNVVMPVRLNGASVDEGTLRAISSFVLLYVGAWAVGAAIIAIDSAISGVGLGTLDSLAASATALGNIGPGFGITGPSGSFASLGDVSKVTLIGLMWVGRLEIVPVAVLLTRHYWRL